MAWYDVTRWEKAIQTHAETNTYTGLVRAIIKYYNSDWIYHELASNNTWLEADELEPQKMELLIRSLCACIRNTDYASYKLYSLILDIIKGLKPVAIDHGFAIEHIIQTEKDDVLNTRIPPWYAHEIKSGRIPIEGRLRDEFRNAYYDVDFESVKILRDEPVFDEYHVIVHSSFYEKDAELYEEMFDRVFTSPEMTRSKARDFLKNLNYVNADLLKEDHLEKIWKLSGSSSFLDFIISHNIRPDILFKTSVSIYRLFEIMEHIIPFVNSLDEDIGSNYLHEAAFEFGKRKDITPELFMNHLTTYNWWRKEPNVTFEFIKGLLYSEYKPVFKKFLSRKDIWISYLARYKRVASSRNWGILCLSLSRSKNIEIDDIKKLDIIDWDWEELSRNSVISTPENIESHPELPWVWGNWGISYSPNLTPEFIRENINKGLVLSRSFRSNEGTVSENLEVITPELIDEYPDYWSYGYGGLSSCENITLPWFIKNIKNPWEISLIVSLLKPDEDIAASAIQSWWKLKTTRIKCRVLSEEICEWWYHPDCKPASKIRNRMFMEHMSSSI